MGDIDLSQFHQVFFEETAEHLATLESLLLNFDIENDKQLILLSFDNSILFSSEYNSPSGLLALNSKCIVDVSTGVP